MIYGGIEHSNKSEPKPGSIDCLSVKPNEEESKAEVGIEEQNDNFDKQWKQAKQEEPGQKSEVIPHEENVNTGGREGSVCIKEMVTDKNKESKQAKHHEVNMDMDTHFSKDDIFL
jgi:hypothetical protein